MKLICAASDCNKIFYPRSNRQLYCTTRCRDREKMRKYRKIRAKQGLCPQCGGEMDSPVSPHRNKVSPQYCSKCQEYYRLRHQRYREKTLQSTSL